MKAIGIVGGIARASTLVYYEGIHEYFKTRNGSDSLHTPKLVLAQTDFALIKKAQAEGHWDEVGRLLAAEANKLKAAGADLFILACNTVHTADEFIIKHVDLPLVHIVDVTAEIVAEMGCRTVGLLGSRYTMRGTYFVGRLQEKYGLQVLVDEGGHEENVHHALYNELAKNIFLEETRIKFQAAIDDLIARGAEAIILGCTEFGILVKEQHSSVPVIDTSIVHARAAVDFALEGSGNVNLHQSNMDQ